MDINENSGGELTNEEIEKDQKVKGAPKEPVTYRGSQDTGNKSTTGVQVKSVDDNGAQEKSA